MAEAGIRQPQREHEPDRVQYHHGFLLFSTYTTSSYYYNNYCCCCFCCCIDGLSKPTNYICNGGACLSSPTCCLLARARIANELPVCRRLTSRSADARLRSAGAHTHTATSPGRLYNTPPRVFSSALPPPPRRFYRALRQPPPPCAPAARSLRAVAGWWWWW